MQFNHHIAGPNCYNQETNIILIDTDSEVDLVNIA